MKAIFIIVILTLTFQYIKIPQKILQLLYYQKINN